MISCWRVLVFLLVSFLISCLRLSEWLRTLTDPRMMFDANGSKQTDDVPDKGKLQNSRSRYGVCGRRSRLVFSCQVSRMSRGQPEWLGNSWRRMQVDMQLAIATTSGGPYFVEFFLNVSFPTLFSILFHHAVKVWRGANITHSMHHHVCLQTSLSSYIQRQNR